MDQLLNWCISQHTPESAFTEDRRKCTMVKVMMHVTDWDMANTAGDFVSCHSQCQLNVDYLRGVW
eukprot:scaffold110730_cov59-Attheya_sp.AAC.4